jgi:predicted MFS family arabinose efflux permease
MSAAVTALLADHTRDEVRTKAMALVGGSIGLMFALSLVLAPVLTSVVGLHGLFALTGLLALTGMVLLIWWVPAEPAVNRATPRGSLMMVMRQPALLRLNLGVFVLHAVQLAMWVAVPGLLVQAGLARAQHWSIYLPAVVGSFVVMAAVFPLERRGHLRRVFLAAIGMIATVELGLWWVVDSPTVVALGALLFVFFCGFNVLEATQPSLVSRLAPKHSRGAALGVYNTLQSLGFFAGGVMGGWVSKHMGPGTLFVTCAAAMVLWLWMAWPMKLPARQAAVAPVQAA